MRPSLPPLSTALPAALAALAAALPSTANAAEPGFDDGELAVAVAGLVDGDGTPITGTFLVGADGTNVRCVAPLLGPISPDGRLVAFERLRVDAEAHLLNWDTFVRPTGGGTGTACPSTDPSPADQLVASEASGTHSFAFSRDGRRLVAIGVTESPRDVHISERTLATAGTPASSRVLKTFPPTQTIGSLMYRGADAVAYTRFDNTTHQSHIESLAGGASSATAMAPPVTRSVRPSGVTGPVVEDFGTTSIRDVEPDGERALLHIQVNTQTTCVPVDLSGADCTTPNPRAFGTRFQETTPSGGTPQDMAGFPAGTITENQPGGNTFTPITRIPLAYSPTGDRLAVQKRAVLATNPDGTRRVRYDLVTTNRTGGDERLVGALGVRLNESNFEAAIAGDGSFVSVHWLPKVVAVAVGSRPPLRTNEHTASIAFSVDTAIPGRVRCRVDDDVSRLCSSPLDLTGLSEGEHVARLAFRANGSDDDGPETEVRWTVDTTAPHARVGARPPFTTPQQTATIAFDSVDADVEEFRCTIDGGREAPCTSPLELRDLVPGLHDVLVRAADTAGNVEPGGADVRWTVEAAATPPGSVGTPAIPGTPAPVTCAAPGLATFGGGAIFIVAREPAGCLVPAGSTAVREARGRIAVNGMELIPRGSTRIRVRDEGARISVETTGPATLALGSFELPLDERIDWDMTAAAGAAAGISRLIGVVEAERQTARQERLDIQPICDPEKAGLRFGSFYLMAVPSAELTADNGGQTKITLKLGFPKVFRSTPGQLPAGACSGETGAALEVQAILSNTLGLRFGGKLTAPDLYLLGQVKLSGLSAAFDPATRGFDGSATLQFPKGSAGAASPIRDAKITATIGLGGDVPGILESPLRKLALGGAEINRELADGIYAQRLGAELGSAPSRQGGAQITLAGTGGVSLGPRLPAEQTRGLFAGEVAALDGKVTVKVPDPGVAGATARSVGLEFGGTLKFLDVLIGTAKLEVTDGILKGSGTYDLTVLGQGFVGTYNEIYYDAARADTSTEGTGTLRLGGGVLPTLNLQARTIVGSKGLAACGAYNGVAVGLMVRWDAGEVVGNRILGSCDLQPLRADGATPRQAGAAGAGGRTVTVPAGLAVLGLEVAHAAADLQLVDPAGRVRAVDGRDVVAIADPTRGTTTLLVRAPARGRWTLRSASGAALPAVSAAEPAPAPKVTGTLRAAPGGRLQATWRASGLIAGDRLVVRERAGGSARVLRRTGAASGTLRFTPLGSRAGRHDVEAVVERHGLPRAVAALGHRTVVPVKVKAVTALRLDRTGRTVTWHASAGARSYAVAVTGIAAATVTREVRVNRLRLPGTVDRGRAIAVIVTPVGATGPGRPRRAVLRRPGTTRKRPPAAATR